MSGIEQISINVPTFIFQFTNEETDVERLWKASGRANRNPAPKPNARPPLRPFLLGPGSWRVLGKGLLQEEKFGGLTGHGHFPHLATETEPRFSSLTAGLLPTAHGADRSRAFPNGGCPGRPH